MQFFMRLVAHNQWDRWSTCSSSSWFSNPLIIVHYVIKLRLSTICFVHVLSPENSDFLWLQWLGLHVVSQHSRWLFQWEVGKGRNMTTPSKKGITPLFSLDLGRFGSTATDAFLMGLLIALLGPCHLLLRNLGVWQDRRDFRSLCLVLDGVQ